MMKYLIGLIVLCVCQVSFASSMYKCQTASGMTYQQTPCSVGAKVLSAKCSEQAGYGYSYGDVTVTNGSCEDKYAAEDKERTLKQKKEEADHLAKNIIARPSNWYA